MGCGQDDSILDAACIDSCAPGKYQTKTCTAGVRPTTCASCTTCSPGKYEDYECGGEKDRRCYPCPSGQFTDANNQQTCKRCGKGKYAESKSASRCKSCPNGKYNDENTNSIYTCSFCRAGKQFINRDKCENCPAGKVQPLSMTPSVVCRFCPGGYQVLVNWAECEQCARGKYQPDNSQQTGNSQEMACKFCPRGKQYVDRDVNCEDCEIGKVQTEINVLSASCVFCVAGKYFISKNSGCQDCVPGKYQSSNAPGTVSCNFCLKGKYFHNKHSDCKSCPTGYYQNENEKIEAMCETCSAGSGFITTKKPCESCTDGKYQNQNNEPEATCKVCSSGFYFGGSAAESCKNCDVGKYRLDNVGLAQDPCLFCVAGKYFVDKYTACKSCPIGWYQHQNDSPSARCQKCAAGAGFVSSTQECIGCASGKYATVNDIPGTICKDCGPEGHASASNAEACTACSSGLYQSQAVASEYGCKTCEKGQQFVTTNQNCEACEVGKYQDEVAPNVLCKTCSAGKEFNTKTNPCLLCKEGEYQSSNSQVGAECKKCSAGQSSVGTGNRYCTICPEGQYQGNEGARTCLDCGKGKAAASRASAEGCNDCVKGRYQPSSPSIIYSCSVCPKGYYVSSSQGSSCTACPAGKLLVDATDNADKHDSQGDCMDCPISTYNPFVGQSSCLTCTFNSAEGMSTCILDGGEVTCNPGEFTDGSSCASCIPGQYTPNLQSSSCDDCPKGFYSLNSGATECLKCPSGRYGDAAASNAIDNCKNCARGRYSEKFGLFEKDQEDDGWCKPCIRGKWSPDVGSMAESSCQDCTAGKYSSTKAAVAENNCINCPAGSYGTFIGADEPNDCLKCSKGKNQPEEGKQFCLPCEPGKYQEFEGEDECTSCSSGYYNMITASTSCKVCAAGRDTNGQAGESDCTQCPAGTMKVSAAEEGAPYSCADCAKGRRAQQGADTCDNCDPGFYQDMGKQSLCKACAEGKWSDTTGATSESQCKNCLAGKYVNAKSSSSADSCVDCPPGKTAGEPGATDVSVCTKCVIGKFSVGGEEQCTSCPKGYVQPNEASATCFKCGAGEIARDNGLVCDECDKGTFRAGDDPQLSACKSCPTGWSQNVKRQAACSPCVRGKYAGAPSQHECTVCPVGKQSTTTKSESCNNCELGKNTGDAEWTLDLNTAQPMTERIGTRVTQGSASGLLKTTLQNAWTLTFVSQDIEEQRAGVVVSQEGVAGSITGTLKRTVEGSTTEVVIQTASDVTFVDDANLVIGSTTVLADKITAAENTGLTASVVIRATTDVTFDTETSVLIGSTTVTTANINTFVNTHTPEGAVRCLLCTGGRSGTPCTDCAVGQYRPGSSTTAATCHECPVGWYADVAGLSSCLPCVPGKYQEDNGKSQCDDCSKGKFSDSVKSSTCSLCPIGQSVNRTGSASCRRCDAGKYGDGCMFCKAGQFRSGDDQDSTKCKLCPRGWSEAGPGQATCVPCDPGKQQNVTGSIKCDECSENTHTKTSMTKVCKSCPEGRTSVPGSVECTSCKTGQRVHSFWLDFLALELDFLALDRFSVQDGEGCMVVDNGSCFQSANYPNKYKLSSGCTVVVNKLSTIKILAFDVEPAYVNEQGVVHECEYDFITVHGRKYCGSEGPATDVTDIPLNTSSVITWTSDRFRAKTGFKICGVDYVDPRIDSTTLAARNKISPDDYICLDCKPGTWAQAGDKDCTPCAPGFYQSQSAAAACIACMPGKYTNSVAGAKTQDACLDCVPGTYSSAFGASSLSSCGQCPPGKASNVVGASTASVCRDCSSGQYAPPASVECTDCVTGTYTSSAGGAGVCIQCSPGKYGDKRIEPNGCVSCPLGWKRSEEDTDLTKCVRCQLGEKSERGALLCGTCNLGTKGKIDKHGECEKCESGKYQDARGKDHCLVCQVGKYANGNQTACEPPVWKLPHDCIKDTEYLDDASPDKMDWRCTRSCKSIGAECGLLSSLYANETEKLSTPLIPKLGYWKIPPALNPDIREPFVECRYKEDCLWNATSNTTCRNHTKGTLCATCVVGYDRIAGYCVKCRVLEVPMRLGLLLLFVVVLFCLLQIFRKKIQKLHAKYGEAWRDFALAIKIMITFTQISLSLPWMLGDFQFPDLYIKFLKRLSIVNVNFLDLIGIQCVVDMDYRYGVFMAFGIPFLVMTTCWIAYQCGKHSVLQRNKVLSEEERKQIMQTVFRIADYDESGDIDEMEFENLLQHMTKKKERPTSKQVHEVMMLAGARKIKIDDEHVQASYHLLLSRENFMKAVTKNRRNVRDWSTLNHLHISDVISDKRAYQWAKLHQLAATWLSGAIQLLLVFHAPVSARAFYYFDCHKLGDRYFLRQDYQIECSSPKWNAFLPFALGLLFGFALAVPVGLGLILCINRQRLHTPDVRQRIGFLYNRFVPGAEWWEIHEVVRKMMLCGLLVYLPTLSRAASAILICLISVATLNYVRPHKNKFLFWASEGSFLLTACKYLTTIFAKAVSKTGQGTRDNMFLAYFLIIFDCLVLFGGLFVLVMIICMLRLDINNLKRSGRLDAEYDEETEHMIRQLRRLSKSTKKLDSVDATESYNPTVVVPQQSAVKSSWDFIGSQVVSDAIAEKKVEKTEEESSAAHDAIVKEVKRKGLASHQRLERRLVERQKSASSEIKKEEVKTIK